MNCYEMVIFTRRRGGRLSCCAGKLDMRRFKAAAGRRQHEQQGVQDDFRLHDSLRLNRNLATRKSFDCVDHARLYFRVNKLKLKIKII